MRYLVITDNFSTPNAPTVLDIDGECIALEKQGIRVISVLSFETQKINVKLWNSILKIKIEDRSEQQ